MPRRFTSVALSGLFLLATASTAQADSTNIRNPSVQVVLTEISGGTRVCSKSTSHYPGSWSMGINGARVGVIDAEITGTAASPPATAFNACVDVFENGALAGKFYVDVVFYGGESSEGTDRAGVAHGIAAWMPGQPDFHFTSGDG